MAQKLNDQLQICHTWRLIIEGRKIRYEEIKDPLKRILPALREIRLRIELAALEEELCEMIQLPAELYECTSKKPNQP